MNQYLRLDEALIQTAFLQWTEEEDPLLSELCGRFMHRKLYKYVEIDNIDLETIDGIRHAFNAVGLHPNMTWRLIFQRIFLMIRYIPICRLTRSKSCFWIGTMS